MGSRPFNYYNYFTEVEEFFVQKRGKHCLLSPLDWTLIETWQQAGVPLHVALRGIDRAMALFQARQVHQRFVNSLFFCHQAVSEEYEQYLLALTGKAGPPAGETGEGEEGAEARGPEADESGTDPEPEPGPWLEFLGRLQEALAQFNREAPVELREAGERAAGRVQEIRQACQASRLIDPERLNRDLHSIEEGLLTVLEDAMPAVELEQLRRQCKQELKQYRQNLNSDMYRKILENYRRKLLRQYYRLPDFSVLGVG